MTQNTKKQISDLNIDPNLPLMIFDADEVLVHFAEPFSNYLKKQKSREKDMQEIWDELYTYARE